MNYQRIYDQLIADRRANPPSSNEYVEVHHILPRCMGGGNEPENLVRLRPEDHFFAHLLLAWAHGGSLWAAIRVMAGAALGVKPDARRIRFGKSMPKLRRTYAVGRRWADTNLRGLGSPVADQTVYHFSHTDGREEFLTRVEMCEKHGVDSGHIGNVVRGVTKSHSGWYMPERDSLEDIGVPSGTNHPMADRTIYKFVNVDGREFVGRRLDLASNDNVPQASINSIITGSCLSAYGWYLPELVPDGVVGRAATSGDRCGTADKNVYLFKRLSDGLEKRCTRRSLIAEFSLTAAALDTLFHGASLSSQGWYLPDRNPDGISGPPSGDRNNKFNPTKYHFVHDDGREEKMTLHAMHLKYGGNRACWNKPIDGGTYKGWALFGANPKRSSKSVARKFRHSDGRVFVGTQVELARANGFSDTCSWRIVNWGDTSHGWSLDDGTPSNDNHIQLQLTA